MTKAPFLTLIAIASASAAITNVRVAGTTATQAVLEYTAPDTGICTVAVSQSATFAPLVPDVDPAVFAGANQDNRAGSISSGLQRVFVAGKRAAETGVDGRFHSRALQAYTLHYFLIACGTDTATGTFQTANIPIGATSPEVYPVDPANPGSYAWPNMNQSLGAGESIIDPLTGALLRRITGANTAVDNTYTGLPNLGAFDDSGSGNPWSITGSALPATYTADGTHAPTKLYVPINMSTATQFAPNVSTPETVNWVQVSIAGSTVGSGGDTTLNICLTINGVTCAPGSPNLLTVTPTSTATLVPASPQPYLADWFGWAVPPFNTTDIATRPITATYTTGTGALVWTGGNYFDRNWTAGTHIWLGTTPYKLASYTDSEHAALAGGLGTPGTGFTGQSFGLLLWKNTNTSGTAITVSSITANVQPNRGEDVQFWNAGYSRQCNPNAVQVGGEWGYYCQLYGVSNGFAWIGSTTGNVLHLGVMSVKYSAGSNGNGWNNETVENLGNYVYDPTRAASFYFIAKDSNNKYVLGRMDYTGANVDIPSYNYVLAASYMAQTVPAAILTPYNPTGTHYDLETLLNSFDSRFASCGALGGGCYCSLVGQHGNKLLGQCWAGQDTPPAVVFALDPTITPGPTTNPIIAMMDLVNVGSPYPNPDRWCVLHGTDTANYPWFKPSTNNYYGAGFSTTLSAAITSTTATDVYVSGDPGGGTAYDIARVGDLFVVDDGTGSYEVMKITSIPTPGSHWVVQRAYNGGGESPTAYTHANGASVSMHCGGSGLGSLAWDYLDDPHGLNARGTTVMQDPSMATGHADWGPWNNFIRIAAQDSDPLCTTKLGLQMCFESRSGTYPGSLNAAPSTYFNDRPGFASLQPPYSITENHPSQVQESAAPWNQNWFLDSRPMIYGWAYAEGTSITNVTGSLYTTTQTLHPKLAPTLASCGEHPLLDISPGPIDGTTANNWKYCIGVGCYSGAVTGQPYVNCPDRTYSYEGKTGCAHSGSDNTSAGADPNGDLSEDICIGDGIWALGSPLVQLDATRTDGAGRYQRVITYGLMRHKHQGPSYVANGKALPDGSWALFETPWVDEQYSALFEAQLPPWPGGDSVNRTTFTPLQIQLGSVPAGTANVIVQFGYNPSFYCTSRQEACIANQSTINETTPFYWASETYSGLACSSGCTVVIPAVPQRIVYYRVQYRTASGSVIATAATAVAGVL